MLVSCKDEFSCSDLSRQWADDWPVHRTLSQATVNPHNPQEIAAFLRTTNEPNSASGLYYIDIAKSDTLKLFDGLIIDKPDWSVKNWLVFTALDGQIYKVRPNGDSLIRLTNVGGNYEPCWSPNGNKIAFRSTRDISNTRVYIMTASGDSVWLASDNEKNIFLQNPIWSTDGSQLAVVYTSGVYRLPAVLDLNTGLVKEYSVAREANATITLDWLEGSDIIVVAGDEGVYLFDIEDERRIDILPTCNEVIYLWPEAISSQSKILVSRLLKDNETEFRTDLMYVDYTGSNQTLIRLFE